METQINNTGAGYSIGGSVSEKVGLHGATPVVQRAGAAQATVAAVQADSVEAASPTTAEFNTALAKIRALVVLTNELRAALVEMGVIKGAA